jgi:hypothetical protein
MAAVDSLDTGRRGGPDSEDITLEAFDRDGSMSRRVGDLGGQLERRAEDEFPVGSAEGGGVPRRGAVVGEPHGATPDERRLKSMVGSWVIVSKRPPFASPPNHEPPAA